MRAQGPLQAPTPTVGGHRRRATSGTLASWALTPVSTGPAHLHGAPPKAAKSPQTAAWCQRSAEGQQEQKMAGRPLCPRRPRPQPANRPFTASVSSSVTGPGHPQLQPWASTPPRAKVHNLILAPSGACRGDGQGPSARAVFSVWCPCPPPATALSPRVLRDQGSSSAWQWEHPSAWGSRPHGGTNPATADCMPVAQSHPRSIGGRSPLQALGETGFLAVRASHTPTGGPGHPSDIVSSVGA